MKSFMAGLLILVICVLLIGGLVVGYMAATEQLYPWWLFIQRKSVESSKSFTDSNNNMLQAYILEYARLETKISEVQDNESLVAAYQAQQKAIITKMCTQISTMKRDTVNPTTLQWLQQKGNCR
jgi:exopolysaccharide biosynthesis protein